MTTKYEHIVNDKFRAYKEWAADLEDCEQCGQDLSELKSPNCQELCIDCTGESDWEIICGSEDCKEPMTWIDCDIHGDLECYATICKACGSIDRDCAES